jgi:hypothetical protein
MMSAFAVVIMLCSTSQAQDFGQGFDTGGNNAGLDSGSTFGGNSKSIFDRSRSNNPRTDRDSQRDAQRRDTSRARNSSQRTPSSSRSSSSSASKGGKTQSTIKGKPAAKKSTGASTGGGQAHATTNVEFKMKADPNTNLLLIESAERGSTMNMNVLQGDPFVTRTVFKNARRSHFKSVDISIKYDPDVMTPQGLDDSGLSSLLLNPSLAQVNSRKGIISYHADFSEEQNSDKLTLFRIKWKTLLPIGHTELSFLNSVDYPSRVMRGDVNVLIQRDETSDLDVSENTGLLGADVAILPNSQTAAEIEANDTELSGISLANSISQGTAEGGIALSLRSRKASVSVGQDFLVDIVYNNPNHAEMDMVKLKLRFDPKVLQVVDYDTDNWITNGINIFDGAYHDDLPFDHQIRNQAFNSSGLIMYTMGFGEQVRVPSSGVIATIRFQAIASAPETRVAFQLDESSTEPDTTVSFLGFNLIGVPGARASSLTDVQLAVLQ